MRSFACVCVALREFFLQNCVGVCVPMYACACFVLCRVCVIFACLHVLVQEKGFVLHYFCEQPGTRVRLSRMACKSEQMLQVYMAEKKARANEIVNDAISKGRESVEALQKAGAKSIVLVSVFFHSSGVSDSMILQWKSAYQGANAFHTRLPFF